MIWYFLGLLIVMLVAAVIHSASVTHPTPPGRLFEIWLMHLLCWGVGIRALSVAIIILYEPVAVLVDDIVVWVVENPFQLQAAFASLAIGVLGVICQWIRGAFWLATVVATCVYSVGVLIVTFTMLPSAALVVYAAVADLALPIALIVCMIGYRARAGAEAFWSTKGTGAKFMA